MATHSESDLRALNDFSDTQYSGEKDKYDITASLDTHRSAVAAVNTSAEQFLRTVKAEMLRLMEQVEKARTEMNTDSATLLALLKMLPEEAERKDAPGARGWAQKP